MVVKLGSVFFFALISVAQARPLLVPDARIAALRSDAKVTRSVLKKCAAERAEATRAVADLAPAPHYTTQGSNPDDDQAKALTGDIRRAYRAALCYRLTNTVAYARQTQAIADAWAGTMKSASNAQGRSDINFNIAQLVVAASWVEGVSDWNATPFKNWLKTVIAPLSLSAEPNNRGNWGNLQDVAIAAFINDEPALATAAARWQALLTSEVAEDGTMPWEICRSNSSDHCSGPDKGVNGLAYTHYALLPATIAGDILEAQNQKSFGSPSGASFGKAFQKAAAFTQNPTLFPYYASNNGKLNKIDHCSYFALAALYFPNENARTVLGAGTCKSDIWMLQKLFGAN
jgi:hypothetical protein